MLRLVTDSRHIGVTLLQLTISASSLANEEESRAITGRDCPEVNESKPWKPSGRTGRTGNVCCFWMEAKQSKTLRHGE
ncbi:hypothetical protein Tco_0722188 [Tanacetum coccineum]